MAKVNGFMDLIGWQKSMDLVEEVYRVSASFTADERFGLTAQVRRAAVSIPSNVAEGYGRSTKADYIRFIDIAKGSANEVETQLRIAQRLRFVKVQNSERALAMAVEVQRILRGLGDGLRRSTRTSVNV
jgi:four helix bundle protein